MKNFLYLIQSHIDQLDHYKDQISEENADILYLTFEKKIDKENFLYGPNTSWEQGRNLLYEKAKNLDTKYK